MPGLVGVVSMLILEIVAGDLERVISENQALKERIQGVVPDAEERAETIRSLSELLIVKKIRGGDVSPPSELVDKVWHEFILHTREYMDFCERHFGEYIHHRPYPSKNDLQP